MKVSIISRTCKRPNLWKRALASIELQTHKDWEVLIFDDGATTENFEIYLNFKKRNADKRIMYVTTKEAYDMFRNSWLYSPKLSNGDIMVRLDDDDMLTEDALEYVVKAYEKNPQLDFTYGTTVTNEDGELGSLIEGCSPFEAPASRDAWAPYTIPNNKPWHDPWCWYRDYYPTPRHFTSIIHAAKVNFLCIYHLYTMRTESVRKVVDNMTVQSKFVDDLEFLGTLDYLGLSHAPLKKVLLYYGIHKQGKVSDPYVVVDNIGMYDENFRIRDKVDHSRPDGFYSRVINLDIENNKNNGVDDELKKTFKIFNSKIDEQIRGL
jgi:glycosyltransferase involved in cell wall biosynthesis